MNSLCMSHCAGGSVFKMVKVLVLHSHSFVIQHCFVFFGFDLYNFSGK